MVFWYHNRNTAMQATRLMNAPPLPPDPPVILGADGRWHIDVRGLAPPQPLVAILRRIDAHGDDGRPLVVHHDRDPALLYPELAERGWRAEPIAGEPGEVRLLLQPW